MLSHSVVCDSLWPQGPQPARLLCPWDSPGKNTGVGYHALLQGIIQIQGITPASPGSPSPPLAGRFFITENSQINSLYLFKISLHHVIQYSYKKEQVLFFIAWWITNAPPNRSLLLPPYVPLTLIFSDKPQQKWKHLIIYFHTFSSSSLLLVILWSVLLAPVTGYHRVKM